MKKLLLTLAVVLGFGAIASATETTVDFGTAEGLPTAESATATDLTLNNIEFSFVNCKKGTYSSQSYIQISGKSYTTGAYMTFTLTEKCEKVVLHTGSNASTNVTVTLYAGETALVSDKKLDTKDSDFTFDIPAANQAPGTVYKLVTTNKYNAQITKMVFTTASTGVTKKSADLSFGETTTYTIEMGDAFTAPTLTKATTAAVTYTSSEPTVAEVDAASGAVTVKGTGTTKIKATAAENDEYYGGTAEYTLNVIKTTKVDLVNIVFDGKFALYIPGQGVATPFSDAFGYFFPEEVTVADNAFDVNEAYLFTFAKSGENWTIQNAAGKYIGMDATHKSFNSYDTADAEGSNCYWTVTFDGNNVKIANIGRTGFYMYCCQYQGKWEITNTDAELGENEFLPQLFGDKAAAEAAGIADIATEAVEGAAEYYNLQGIRMQGELAPGLYIRREGNKASKILVR